LFHISDSIAHASDVAKTGFEAMLKGDLKVAGFSNKLRAAMAHVVPGHAACAKLQTTRRWLASEDLFRELAIARALLSLNTPDRRSIASLFSITAGDHRRRAAGLPVPARLRLVLLSAFGERLGGLFGGHQNLLSNHGTRDDSTIIDASRRPTFVHFLCQIRSRGRPPSGGDGQA
jgi:hypothetical protein